MEINMIYSSEIPARDLSRISVESPSQKQQSSSSSFQSHTEMKSDKKRFPRRPARRRRRSHSSLSHPERRRTLYSSLRHPGLMTYLAPLLFVFLFHPHPIFYSGVSSADAASNGDGATNAGATDNAKDAFSPPVFVEEPKPLEYVSLNHAHLLTCSAQGSEPLQYRWTKEGAGLVTPFSTNGVHRISAMKTADYGVYRCLVKNEFGAVLSRQSIIVLAKLELKALEGDSVQNETVLGRQGESALLQLASKYRIESQPEAVVQWVEFKPDGTKVSLKDDGGRRSIAAASNDLALLSLSSKDRNSKIRAQILNPTIGLSFDSIFWNVQVEQPTGAAKLLRPEIVVPPQTTKAKEGDSSVTFDCIVNAHPIDMVRIKWRRNGVELHPSDKYLLSSKDKRRHLIVANPSTADSGIFSCEATLLGHDFKADVRSAQLTVDAAPSFSSSIRLPLVSSVRWGDALTLPCAASGTPKPEVTWYKDGVAILTNEVRKEEMKITKDNDLILQNAEEAQAGVYQCIAINSAGEASVHSLVKVNKVRPYILTPPPANVSAVDGAEVTLSCGATGAPQPEISWIRQKEDEAIESDQTKYVISPSGDLIIKDTSSDDIGSYCCRAFNLFGEDSACAFVKVAVKTQIVQPPKDTSVIISLRASLFCGVAHDADVDVEIEWSFNGRTIPKTNRIMQQKDGTLRIKNARHQDAGTYVCRVKSSGGDDQRSAELKVIQLPYAPTGVVATLDKDNSRYVKVKWIKPFNGNSPINSFVIQTLTVVPKDKKKNSKIKGKKKIEYIPEAHHGWKTVASEVLPEKMDHTLTTLIPASSYKFRVAATNQVGEGEFSQPSDVVTIPQEAPSEPPRLWASSASTTTIMVEWQPPPSEGWNGVLAGFILEYRLAGYTSLPWTFVNISDPSQNQFLIKELMIWKLYAIRMAAFNGKGIGVYSPILTVRTKEGVPDEAPTKVMGNVVNSTAVHLMWTPPPRPSINGINQGYKIRAFPAVSSSPYSALNGSIQNKPEVEMSVDPDPRNPEGRHNAILNGLRKFTEYRVVVLCYTSAGNGKPANPLLLTTKQDIPDKVAKLEFTEVLDRSITVHWEPPTFPNGILTKYTLYREETGSSKKGKKKVNRVKIVLDPLITSHVIEGLKPETSYTISVSAATSVGEGPKMTSSVESGVPPEFPDPPKNLAVSDITADSALVQYSPGFNGKTSITKWIVEGIVNFKEDEVYRSDWKVIYETADLEIVDSFRIQGLKPYTWYQLRVIKENIMGRSSASRPTRRFQTLQAAPRGAPENVIISAINATALRVTWTPLPDEHWNGNPAGYKLLYYPDLKHTAATDHILIIRDPNVNTVILHYLEEFTQYNVKMSAFNDFGASNFQFVGSQFTMESTPAAGPENVKAVTGKDSATQIDVSWGNVPDGLANGIIIGFKIHVTALTGHVVNGEERRKREERRKSSNFYDDDNDDENRHHIIVIQNNSTRFKRLNALKKYTTYSIRVSAFTRMGEGELSTPVHARTGESTPGVVSSVRFPHVSFDAATVVWETPTEPNGVIIGYQVQYWLHEGEAATGVIRPVTSPLLFNETTKYEVSKGLEREKYYYFVIKAKTRLGWGDSKKLLVYTVAYRRIAEPPRRPTIGEGQVEAASITMNWSPGDDGYAPIRYFTIQYQLGGNEGMAGEKRRRRWASEGGEGFSGRNYDDSDEWSKWKVIGGFIDPLKTTFTLQGLRPYTQYRFRISATNDIGTSAFSVPSEAVITLTASPDSAPESVKVVPIKEDVVQVAWMDSPKNSWNGPQLLGYVVQYRQISNPSWQEKLYQKIISNPSLEQPRTLDLENLVKDKRYEVQVYAYNIQGPGRPSATRVVDVGVAIPSGSPREFKAVAVGPTEINITWAAPLQSDLNGNLLGYKLFMWEEEKEVLGDVKRKMMDQMRIIGYKHTNLLLSNLTEYSTYHFRILAYNSAGDGKNSSQRVSATTHQDLPSVPSSVSFSNLTLGSVRVNWGAPAKKNGVILGYEVVYEDEAPRDGVSKTVRVQVAGDKNHQKIKELRYESTYDFKVRAKTLAGWGPFNESSIRVGPQQGSPAKVEELWLRDRVSKNYLEVTWKYGDNEFPPVGFILEKKSRDDRGGNEEWERPWEYVAQEDSLLEKQEISWKTLKATAQYKFRVIAYNYAGPSLPTETVVFSPPQDLIPANPLRTSGNASWYKEWWFRITMAMGALVILTILVATLVVVGRNRDNDRRQKALKRVEHVRTSGLVNPTLDREEDDVGNGGFATCDTKKSIRKTIKRAVHHGASNGGGVYRPPPLPTPAAIYEEDNELGNEDGDSHSSEITTEKDVESITDETEEFIGRGEGSESPEHGTYPVRAAMAIGRLPSTSTSSKGHYSLHNSSNGSASPSKRLIDAASPMGGGSHSGGSTSGSHRQLYFQAPLTPSDIGSVSAMGGCPLINAKRHQTPQSPELTVDHFDTTSFVNHYAAANEALGQNSWRQQRPTAFSYRPVGGGGGSGGSGGGSGSDGSDSASTADTPTSGLTSGLGGMTSSESRGGISLSPLGNCPASPRSNSQQQLMQCNSPGSRTPTTGFSSFV